MHRKGYGWIGLGAMLALGLTGCGGGQTPAGGSGGAGGAGGGSSLSGTIKVDGSSTVYPISEAVAEEFKKANSGVEVTLASSGTGGGFKKFGAGEIDISDASRPIKDAEAETVKKAGFDFIELPVAFDAIAVVVHPENTWAAEMTVDELKKLWEPAAQGKVMKWSDVRAGWPAEPIKLYGPGTDSGTFDYFTDAVCGDEGASRGDYTASEDDNVLVQGVSGDKNALGYFGLAYYQQNKDKLKAVAINDGKEDNGSGAQTPSAETVAAGTYQPLARPIFIYVSTKSAERPEVKAFVDFYLTQAPTLTAEVDYVPLTADVYELAKKRFSEKKTGSAFATGSHVGVSLTDLLSKEQAH